MKLKAIATIAAVTPLMVACGSGSDNTTFRLDAAGATFPAPLYTCLLYTSPSPRDQRGSRMPSSA